MAEPAIYQDAVEKFGDWRWRLDNLYWITDEAGEEVKFRLNAAQAHLFDHMDYLNVVLKARQLGFTTFIQIFMLDACFFNSNIHAGTIAHTRDAAEAIFDEKVKFPYERLPTGLRAINPAETDSARELQFANGSVMRVGTSLRSGTYQYLHVSEYGKMCAKYPEKAREVKTGAFNTVHAGQIMFVESTAEGQEGHFYEICEKAKSLALTGAKLTPLDFKFFFFPWWEHPGYVLDHDGVVITTDDARYFAKIEREASGELGVDLTLTAEQKAWYVKKAEQQQSDMKREYPSTPKEAFEASIEGAYYAEQMARMEATGRVVDLPIEGVGVETWWDLGLDDLTSIGWVQRVGPWVHILDYYENSGEGLAHYATVLEERQREHGIHYVDHLWPHDGNHRVYDEHARRKSEIMRGLGYDVRIVPRTPDAAKDIPIVRQLLPRVRIDQTRCAKLVRGLKNYRKEWDEVRGTFKNKPLHNWASHAADMVRTGAMHHHYEDTNDERWDADDEQGRSATSGY